MVSSLKLSNLWRVISDIDLDRIRATADTPFELLVVAEDGDLAERVRVGLGAVDDGGVDFAIGPQLVRLRPRSGLPDATIVVLGNAGQPRNVDLLGALLRVEVPAN